MFIKLKWIVLFMFLISLRLVCGSGLIDIELDGTTPIPEQKLEGTNFIIFRQKLVWSKAYEYCHICVGKYATFPTVEVANMVRNKIHDISTFSEEYDDAKIRQEFGLDRRYWFGLRDQNPTDNEWVWVSNPSSEGTAISPQELKRYPWYPNQPDHNDTSPDRNNEHCAGWWNPGYYFDKQNNASQNKAKHSFNDFPCDHLYYFICEKTDPPPITVEHCKDLQTSGKRSSDLGKPSGQDISSSTTSVQNQEVLSSSTTPVPNPNVPSFTTENDLNNTQTRAGRSMISGKPKKKKKRPIAFTPSLINNTSRAHYI